jgi:hypothetical protein
MVQKRNSQQQQQNEENRSVSECFENTFSHQLAPSGNGTDANGQSTEFDNGTEFGGFSADSSRQFSVERYLLDLFGVSGFFIKKI